MKVLLAALCVVAPAVAQGQVISQPNGALAFGVILATGQSFTATVTGTVSRIDVRSRTTTGTATLRIYQGNNGSGTQGSAGSPDYTQTNVALADAGGDTSGFGFSSITLSTPFPIVVGQQYSFAIQGASISGMTSDPYAGGTKLDDFAGIAPTWDVAFQVLQVEATPVPVLDAAGLLILAAALAGIAATRLRSA